MKTPYNFIPLNERVFCPDWSEQVSMDLPFEDGLFGQIRYRLVAETPVFVDDGHDDFCNRKGDIYIPATSIKGCIRNVLRIISFGRIGDITLQKTKNQKQKYSEPVEHQQTQSPDLADLIFGYVRGSESLRGRVQFSPCVCKELTGRLETSLNLYSPHPEGKALYGKPVSFEGATPEAKGWKRYVMKPSQTNNAGQSTLRPIVAGSTFEGTVRFFNLRPIELGALLSAMTFFGQEIKGGYYHQIGQGKPYGYGRVSLQLLEAEIHETSDVLRGESQPQDEFSFVEYIQSFVNYFDTYEGPNGERIYSLADNRSIREFLTMCSFVAKSNQVNDYSYMVGAHPEDHDPVPYLSEKIQHLADFPKIDVEDLKESYRQSGRLNLERFTSLSESGLEKGSIELIDQAISIYSQLDDVSKNQGRQLYKNILKCKFQCMASLGIAQKSKELLEQARSMYESLETTSKKELVQCYSDVLTALSAIQSQVAETSSSRDPKTVIEIASSIEGLVNNALKWDVNSLTTEILRALQEKMQVLLKKKGIKGKKTINAIAQLNNRLKDNPDWIEIKVE